MIYGILAAAILLFLLFCYYQNNKIDITEYRIENKNIINDIKVAQLSDMHSKPCYNAAEKLREIRPDDIMITGD